MDYEIKFEPRDELRGRFTRFLEVTMKHVRQNYLRKLSREPKTISLDIVSEIEIPLIAGPTPYEEHEFTFEESRLAEAFRQLPMARQKVLIYLFVEEMYPEEIAELMGCTVQHIYNQRSLAVKKLRKLLSERGENSECE